MDSLTAHRKQRLRDLIAGKPYAGSQLTFSKAAGLSEARISQMTAPRDGKLYSFGELAARKLAKALDLDERYFEHGFETIAKETDFVEVRRVDVRFSNGAGQVVYYEDDKPPLSFRADFLRRLSIPPGRAVVVDAQGVSNEPKILDGSVVLINSADTENLNGGFFAFRSGDELLIKRLNSLEGVGIVATAENSNFSPKMKVYTDPESIQIIGRAVWTGTEL